MPLDKAHVIGKDAVLYYSEVWTSPTWTEIDHAQDVSGPNLTKGKVDLPIRGSDYKPKGPGLREVSLEFGYLYQGPEITDDVWTALKDAYLNDTILIFWAADRKESVSGTTAAGFRFPAIVFDFPHNEELESGLVYNVGIELTRAKESSVLLDPEWYELATP